MGGWEFYFILALFLDSQRLIRLQPLEDLAFAALLFVPFSGWRRRVRNVLAWPLALALLYHQSWLPPFSHLLDNLGTLIQFKPAYLADLADRFIRLRDLALLTILWAVWQAVTRTFRVDVILLLVLAAMALPPMIRHDTMAASSQCPPAASTASAAGPGQTASGDRSARPLDTILSQFFTQEAARKASLTVAPAGSPPFDIVILHVCSLAWNDVHAAGLDDHPIWKRFDFLFTRFNSATSYSGPAAIRVLRSTCGQPRQSELYSAAPDDCYLMDRLAKAGYQRELALNHDGHFGNFLQEVQQQRLDMAPLPVADLPVAQQAFDNTPIRDDFDVLSRWLDQRAANPAQQVALYYNTISLHDGNRIDGPDAGKTGLDSYRIRLKRLLDDLNRFIDHVAASRRNTVVILVPEHGAAIAGDSLQISGLRDIPTPDITMVPVGIKLVGAHSDSPPLRIDTPSSYLALSTLLGRFLQQAPFSATGFNPAGYVRDLPATRLVAQNVDTFVVEHADRYWLRMDSTSGWTPLPAGSDGYLP